jgi:hypothetical protein
VECLYFAYSSAQKASGTSTSFAALMSQKYAQSVHTISLCVDDAACCHTVHVLPSLHLAGTMYGSCEAYLCLPVCLSICFIAENMQRILRKFNIRRSERQGLD